MTSTSAPQPTDNVPLADLIGEAEAAYYLKYGEPSPGYHEVSDVNRACGCHVKDRCDGCGVCVPCAGCFCED